MLRSHLKGVVVAALALFLSSCPTLLASAQAPVRLAGLLRDPCASVRPMITAAPQQVDGQLVLVTGGAGFIGSTLTDKLLSLNYRVRVLDDLSTGDAGYLDLSHPRLEFVHGSILNKHLLQAAMVNVTGVFHLAADSKVLPSLSNPALGTHSFVVNAVGTNLVLETALAAGVKKVVYAASSTYYGNPPSLGPMVESQPWTQSSPYAASKYAGELAMMTYDTVYGLPTVGLRFFMVYGPRQPTTGAYAIVTGVFARQAQQGLPLTIEGDGSHFRDFIHVDDIARGCIIAYQSDVHGTVINLGTGTAYSVHEVADMVSPNQVHVPERKNDLVGTLADTCKAKHLLGFVAHKEFKTEMPKVAAALKAGTSMLSPWWADRQLPPYTLQPDQHTSHTRNSWAQLQSKQLPSQSVYTDTRTDWWPLRNNLTALLEARAVRKQVVLLPLTHLAGFWAMACNQIVVLERGAARNWILVAITTKTLDACKAVNFPCFNATQYAGHADLDHDSATRAGGRDFATVSWPKPYTIREVLRARYTAVLLDVDIGLHYTAVQSLLAASPALLQTNVDGTPDTLSSANSGLVVVRPHNQTLALYDQIIDHITKTRATDQAALQHVVGSFVNQLQPAERHAFMRSLPEETGFQVKCHGKPPQMLPLTAHANCVAGFAGKMQWLHSKGVWRLPSCRNKGVQALSEADLDTGIYEAATGHAGMHKKQAYRHLMQCTCLTLAT